MNSQLALGVKLRDSSVFSSYFAGPNAGVLDMLQGIRSGASPTCIFVQGAPGTGKTHLLQAVCTTVSHSGQAAAYLPLSDLGAKNPEIVAGCGELDCVCVDDIERIAGRDDWERAIFGLHQRLDEHQGRLVVSSVFAPAATGIALADLRSRLGGGVVLTLRPLDEQELIEALRLRANLRGFDLPADTAQYLLRRLPRDMKSLCGFLDQLDDASLAAQRKLTVPFVKGVMEGRSE